MHNLVACALALLAVAAGAQESPGGREATALRASQAALGRAAGGWALIDQQGRAVRFETLHDRPLVVSFIYTGCFQVCPATTQFLKRAVDDARRALGPDAFRVVSVGFNQPFDGPEALADFARRQHIDDPQWLFVAPREEDVPALLQRFGLTVERTPGGFDHLVQVSIVDRSGKIVRQVYGDQFDLPLFVEPIKKLVAGETAPSLSIDDIWTKVRLYCTVYDPRTGKYRADYALFFELFAGVTTLGAMGWFLLRNVRRRDR